MSTPFSLYIERDGSFHRLHPLTKLALTGFCLVVGLALPGRWAAYAFYLLVMLPLAAVAGIGRRYLRATLAAVLPFAVSLFLVQGLFWPGGTPVLELGPLSFKAEGVAFALRSTGRILVIVGAFLLLSFTTRPDRLMQALAERGAPRRLTYIMLTAIQIVPHFQSKASAILDAQRSRGLETEGGLRQRARALLPLVRPLVLGSIIDIEERAMALEVRAFGRQGPMTYLSSLRDSQGQRSARWLLVLAAAGLLVARLLGWP
ncbi:MAG: energy-coupling factor transporter transmembrane component T family protein [Candidatus Promineifilaceae bacterium]